MEIQQTGKLHLLWIAIDHYKHKFWPALSNAVSGSEALEGTLHDGFGLTSTRTISLENRQATLAEIEKCLRSFGPGGTNELSDDDQLIISFAGHGERDLLTGETAFIPFEADPDSTSTWYRFDHLRPLLRVINARHILVISDSCFSGGVFRSGVTNERHDNDAVYAKRAYIKNSRQMISSGGVEKVIDDGARPGKSVFLEGLLHGLRTAEPGWMFADKLFRETRNFVVANADQTPEFGVLNRSGHGGGEFIFFHSQKFAALSSEDAATPLAAHEVLTFDSGTPAPEEHSNIQPPLTDQTDQVFVHLDFEALVETTQVDEVLGQFHTEALSFFDSPQSSTMQNWLKTKGEILSRFGESFELADETDIQEFWGILGEKRPECQMLVNAVPAKGISFTMTLLVFFYVHVVYVSNNLWVTDFLTVGAVLYPALILLPLIQLERRNFGVALGQYLIIFTSFLAVITFSGAPLENALGVRPDVSVIGASTLYIKISMFLELLTALLFSALVFLWLKRAKPFFRLVLSTCIGLVVATFVYYLSGFESRLDLFDPQAIRQMELVPLLGFGTPVERYINWFARDSIVYVITSTISAGLVYLSSKRQHV